MGCPCSEAMPKLCCQDLPHMPGSPVLRTWISPWSAPCLASSRSTSPTQILPDQHHGRSANLVLAGPFPASIYPTASLPSCRYASSAHRSGMPGCGHRLSHQDLYRRVWRSPSRRLHPFAILIVPSMSLTSNSFASASPMPDAPPHLLAAVTILHLHRDHHHR